MINDVRDMKGTNHQPTLGEALVAIVGLILIALTNPLVWVGLGIVFGGIYMITH